MTYPDPITPRCDPAALQNVAYDPFGLMPRDLPAYPRVFMSAAQLDRARANLARSPWAKAAHARLLGNCRPKEPFPGRLPDPADAKANGSVAWYAVRNALAALLTGDAKCRERALSAMRLLADGYTRWQLAGGDRLAGGGGLAESRVNLTLAWTFDLLAAAGLGDEDRGRFLAMLAATVAQSDANMHRTCSNHNTWSLAGRLAVAAARGDRQGIHDALYGCDHGSGWRYGVIHQLRHDILSDGLHWEGSLGYHFYTLMAFTEIASAMANLGVDLWNAPLPPLQQDDGKDLHRAYGPAHGTKTFKAAFDAPLYQMLPDGDLSTLHDSGLSHLRGVWIWGILYNKAWEAYGDRRYAWLLSRMEADYPSAARDYPELPMPLNTHNGDLDFARLRDPKWPRGSFSFARRSAISLSGRHEKGCSLFPVHGSAVLRSAAAGPAVGAFLYWGPHVAGHMGPAALHLDLHAHGRRVTDAPHSGGYGDPNHLLWNRTTLAHNTVTVDEASMFPYDFDTESMWECDRWRDRISDGRLLLFQPAPAFKAVRAVNDVVYPGVRLDRTVIVAPGLALDVYRVTADRECQFDWAMHLCGELAPLPGASAFDPGARRGYSLLAGAVSAPPDGDGPDAGWTLRAEAATARILAPPGARLIAARDPVPPKTRQLGALEDVGPRTGAIVRARGRSALFVSAWTFGGAEAPCLSLASGEAAATVTIETRAGGLAARWTLPAAAKPVRMRPLAC